MVVLYFVISISFVIVQTTAFGLFVEEFGSNLPYACLSVALLSSLVAYLYLRLSLRVSFAAGLFTNLFLLGDVPVFGRTAFAAGALVHLPLAVLVLQTLVNLANLIVASGGAPVQRSSGQEDLWFDRRRELAGQHPERLRNPVHHRRDEAVDLYLVEAMALLLAAVVLPVAQTARRTVRRPPGAAVKAPQRQNPGFALPASLQPPDLRVHPLVVGGLLLHRYHLL
jgi:hypothetical protein